MKSLLVLFVVSIGVRGEISESFEPPDIAAEVAALEANDFPAFAALHGMNLTEYEVVTPDGWILQLWRVQSPKIIDAQFSSPVIIFHAFTASSFSYTYNLRNQSIAFILADNGYDVWLSNFRGNQFGNSILSNGERRVPKPNEYYRATWQYMADIDFPCIVDKVLTETEQSKVYLISYSLGSTASFAFLSQNHTYDSVISHSAAVVPVLNLGKEISPPLQAIFTSMAFVPFLPKFIFQQVFGKQVYTPSEDENDSCSLFSSICNLLYNLLIDQNLSLEGDPHLNKSRHPVYRFFTPGGITPMIVYNYAVQWNKDTWRKLDFTRIKQTGLSNQAEYGSDTPPAYNLAATKVPFSLYYVKNDVFTGPATRAQVAAMLNATDVNLSNDSTLNHYNAVVGFDARCFSIDPILLKLESARDENHKKYRQRVQAFLETFPYENGCLNKAT